MMANHIILQEKLLMPKLWVISTMQREINYVCVCVCV